MTFLIAGLFLIACSDEEHTNAMQGIEGIVLGTTSCHTENNGPAYRVSIDGFEPGGFIITADLPDELKEAGTRIKFDMEQSMEGISLCTANFGPDIFYKVSNVTSTGDIGEN